MESRFLAENEKRDMAMRGEGLIGLGSLIPQRIRTQMGGVHDIEDSWLWVLGYPTRIREHLEA